MANLQECLNLLTLREPDAIGEIDRRREALGLSDSIKTAAARGPALGTADASEAPPSREVAFIQVETAERALARLLADGLTTLGQLRDKVQGVDRLRLMVEVIAAVTGAFSASGVWPGVPSQVLAGGACFAAIAAAVIPRLASSDAGQGIPWATHYSQLVDVLAKADGTQRSLSVWLRAYHAGQDPGDAETLVAAANEACGVILREKLLLGAGAQAMVPAPAVA